MMLEKSRIYLDHAATSWPKPPSVLDAMMDYLRDVGATSSRGLYASAEQADQIVRQTRIRIAKLVNAPESNGVSFHNGCTLALNAAIHGLKESVLRPGDQILVGAAEHNAVLRPLHAAAASTGAELIVVPCDSYGEICLDAVADRLNPQVAMVAMSHASNVTGAIQPIERMGRLLIEYHQRESQSRRIVFLCDAAQTLGHVPIDMCTSAIDALAAPAHKGCGGPPGIAMLALAPWLYEKIVPTIQGGTGHDSVSLEMPTTMPMRLEPGTLNVPAIAGWNEAISLLQLDSVRAEHLRSLSTELHRGLSEISQIRLLSRAGILPIASLVFQDGLAPAEAAAILDTEFGIEVRAGLHCAPVIHQHLGTSDGGTLRISAGETTTIAEVHAVIHAIGEIVAA